MTPAEFKIKWDRNRDRETAAYHEHFNDLCGMLGLPTPVEAVPSGCDRFCFQQRVVENLESRGSGAVGAALANERGAKADRERLATFQKKIAETTVLDPACGWVNFLYVALRLLLNLEKGVATCAAPLSFSVPLPVEVTQLRAIELNPYAYELAQVSVQIGALPWRRDNGYHNARTPARRTLDGFENKDALLRETFRKQPKNLEEARAEEHAKQDEVFRVYYERAWPDADILVENPPFMGGTKGGAFDIGQAAAVRWLRELNSHGRPNSNALTLGANGLAVPRRQAPIWIIDFALRQEAEATDYGALFA